MKFLIPFAVSLFSVSAFATPVLDCQMQQNVCGMTGATMTLPWQMIPDANQFPQMHQTIAPFDIVYGYEQATGSREEGSLIIRDQDSKLGAYWGFIPKAESTYFAMIAADGFGGYKMGVKGCAASPRVWSATCRLTTMEALQAEIYTAAGIAPAAPTSPRGHRCVVQDVYQGTGSFQFTVDENGQPVSVFISGMRDGRQVTDQEFLTPSTTRNGYWVGADHGDFTTHVSIDESNGNFWVHTTESHGGSRCL